MTKFDALEEAHAELKLKELLWNAIDEWDNLLGDWTQVLSYLFIYFFLNSVLCPFQDYFSSYETGQSVGGAKTGEPREKPPGTPASRTWLKPTPDTAVR